MDKHFAKKFFNPNVNKGADLEAIGQGGYQLEIIFNVDLIQHAAVGYFPS